MTCQTCEDLLTAYRHSVDLFKDAVQKGVGAFGPDSRVTAEQAARLGQQCKEASDAFMDHWRQELKAIAC
jgi:hypothetical protein